MISIYCMEKSNIDTPFENPMLQIVLVFLLILYIYITFIVLLVFLTDTWIPFPRTIYYIIGTSILWIISLIYLYFDLHFNFKVNIYFLQ